jgi:hypothetical protein
MKSRRFRSLGVAVPEAYGGLGMGLYQRCWFAITFLVQQDLSQLLWSTYGIYYANNFIWY